MTDRVRCCLCRFVDRWTMTGNVVHGMLEHTKLPGSGYRCVDRDACRGRVIEIVNAHVNLAGACNEGTE